MGRSRLHWPERVAVSACAIVLVAVSTAGAARAAGPNDAGQPTILPGVGEVTAPVPGHQRPIEVPVTLDQPSVQVVRAHWTTIYVDDAPFEPEAEAPTTDYVTSGGIVTFQPGQTTSKVSVPVVGDAANQFEYVVVSFTDPLNAKMGGEYGLGEGLIDPLGASKAPTVFFAQGLESNSPPLEVSLSHATSRTVTVQWSVSDGGLIFVGDGYLAELQSQDYSPEGGTITFAPGQTSALIDVTVDPAGGNGCVNLYPCALIGSVGLLDPTNAVVSTGYGSESPATYWFV